jgi:outer membrane protein assembly factor BamB
MLTALLLSGCSSFEGMFSDGSLPPLKGERISILQLQQDLTPNADLQKEPIVLPAAWHNTFWPQAGGYSNHAMGQLALGTALKEAWSVSIGAGGGRRHPLVVQPIVAKDTVFTLDTDGEVTAFNFSDGNKKWRVSSLPKESEHTAYIGGGLAYSGDKLYVTNGYNQLVCLDPLAGKILWRVDVPSPVHSAPTVVDGRVYLITLDNRLMVFSAEGGAPLWNYAGVAETTNLLGSVSPAVDASLVVMPMSSGDILGLRAENGQVVWQDNLSAVRRAGAMSAIADIRGQPVIDQGLVYAVSYSGRMAAIDGISGQRVWQREIGSAETPWTAGATVFILTTEQQLLALSRLNGDIRWIAPLARYEGTDKDKPIVWTGPVLAGGRLILASSDGQMAEVDPQDGKILKQTKLPGDVMVPPLVANGTLLILTEGGKLVAYR